MRPPEGVTISYTVAREFVARAETIRMAEREGLASYLARILSEVFASNYAFNLMDFERCQIM